MRTLEFCRGGYGLEEHVYVGRGFVTENPGVWVSIRELAMSTDA